MIKIIGEESGKVYVMGETRAECFRYLNKKYPYKKGYIYPERLWVVSE